MDHAPGGPPEHLERPLELDPADWPERAVYHLLTGLVIPRPVGWVSTVDAAGVRNVAPHSYFNMVGSDPPYAVFASAGIKDTLRNVRTTGEFVLNIATTELARVMVATSGDLPADVDEFEFFGISSEPAVAVDAPRVAAAPAHLECRARHELDLGKSHLVVAEIVHIHVDPRVWSQGRVDPKLLDPVARLGGTGFARLADHFRIARPKWDGIKDLPADRRIPACEAW